MALTRQAWNEVVNNNTRPKGQGKERERLKNEMFVCVCGRHDQDKELPKCHPLRTFSIYIYVGRPSLMVIGVDLNPHSQGMLEE